MRALVLLLVLMGMAEIGWGQRLYRDTFPHDPDTFVKVGWRYRSLEKVRYQLKDSNPTYYSKHIAFSPTYLGGYIEIGNSYWRLYNKKTNKSYPFSVFTIFGQGFFLTDKLKFGWKMGMDINGYPFRETDRSELFHDFGIDTSRGNNHLLLPISLNLRRPLFQTNKHEIALMAQYSPLIFTGDGSYYTTQSYTLNIVYSRYWQDAEHHYSFISTGLGYRYLQFKNQDIFYKPYTIEFFINFGLVSNGKSYIYKPIN